jgi:hypothetical protein
MILRVWILGILLIVLIWVIWPRKEGFQTANSGSGSRAPFLSYEATKTSFWSLLAEQKKLLTKGSQGSQGSQAAPDILSLISAVSNPMPTDTFKVVFGNIISVYALAKYNMNPRAARSALIQNYDDMQAQLTTQVQTATEQATAAAFKASPQNAQATACAELNTLAMSLYGKVITMAAAVTDLSGTEILAEALHDENRDLQAGSAGMACTRQGATPSRACILLATQDETLFPVLQNYDTANVSLLTNGQTVQDVLDLVIQAYNGLQCPMPQTTPSISSVFSPDYLTSLGIINTQSLVSKLEELSPYYVSPTLVGYITRQLIATDEYSSNIQSTTDYIQNMSKTTNSIVSLTTTLGAGQFYSESGSMGIQSCPAGYYCPPTANSPIPCPVAYYCPPGTTGDLNSEDGTGPKPCPTGTYTPLGASDPAQCTSGITAGYYNNNGIATICPAGTYCPANTPAPVPCPAGTYNPQRGKPSVQGCLNCPAGSYCVAKATVGATSATPCTPGTYSTAIKATAKTTCISCPPGTTCPNKGMALATPCPAGTYSASTGLIGPCTLGPAGQYFSAGSGFPSAGSGFPSVGSSSSRVGATDISNFTTCAAGYYCPAGSAYQVPCPQGTYCDLPGMGAATPCPAGTYGDTVNATSRTCSGICEAGYYCAAGSISATQVECPSGFYCPFGTVSPVVCPVGFYCPFGSSQPSRCPPGTNTLYTQGGAISDCYPCPAGTYCNDNVPTPLPCPIGNYCPLGSSTPYPCTAGSYCDITGLASPTPCPAGTYNSKTSSTTMADCVTCDAGYYTSDEGATSSATCMPCRIGHYCPHYRQCSLYNLNQGSTVGGRPQSIPIGTTTPIPCPAGTYCDTPSMVSPKTCAPGTYSASTGAISAGTCTPCPAGSYADLRPASDTQPYTSATVCRPCPGGTTSSAGATICR